mgnify:FL=1
MGIISDILANVTANQTAKDFGLGALGAVIGAFTTRFVFGRERDRDEDDDYDDD